MINVKRTIYKTLLQKIRKLRKQAQLNEKTFKKILTLIILDDMYDWAGKLNQPQSILNELKDLRTRYILKNCEFDIQKDREYDYYSNVNTTESIYTWMRVFDDPDVVYYSPIQEKCCDPEQDINLNTNEVKFDGESLNIIMK